LNQNIMNFARRIRKKLLQLTIGRLLVRKEIWRLRNEDDKTLKLLSRVFSDVINNKRTNDEIERIRKIETLRNALNKSSDKISVTDYGAGSRLTGNNPSFRKDEIRSVGEVCRFSSKPYKWNYLLFRLVREFRPSVCLELGTAVGISAAYQAAGCELNNLGHVITLEGAESLVSLAEKNFENLGINRVKVISGRFQDTLDKVLVENSPIDFVFIDGHHEEEATKSYFNQIIPYLSEDAIIVFDDIYWSAGMERAWKAIQENSNLKVTIDLLSVGIGIFSKNQEGSHRHFRIPF
jgi:predicted O-methyltransferase YrrM